MKAEVWRCWCQRLLANKTQRSAEVETDCKECFGDFMMTFRQCIFYCVVKCCDAMICVTQNLGAKMTADHLKSAGSPNLYGDYELRMRCGIAYLLAMLTYAYACAACLPHEWRYYFWYVIGTRRRAPYQSGTDSFANPGAWESDQLWRSLACLFGYSWLYVWQLASASVCVPYKRSQFICTRACMTNIFIRRVRVLYCRICRHWREVEWNEFWFPSWSWQKWHARFMRTSRRHGQVPRNQRATGIQCPAIIQHIRHQVCSYSRAYVCGYWGNRYQLMNCWMHVSLRACVYFWEHVHACICGRAHKYTPVICFLQWNFTRSVHVRVLFSWARAGLWRIPLLNNDTHEHNRLNSTAISWWVGHHDGEMRRVHSVNAVLTVPMTTRIIFRTNFRQGDPGFMEDHVFEISHFKFISQDMHNY